MPLTEMAPVLARLAMTSSRKGKFAGGKKKWGLPRKHTRDVAQGAAPQKGTGSGKARGLRGLFQGALDHAKAALPSRTDTKQRGTRTSPQSKAKQRRDPRQATPGLNRTYARNKPDGNSAWHPSLTAPVSHPASGLGHTRARDGPAGKSPRHPSFTMPTLPPTPKRGVWKGDALRTISGRIHKRDEDAVQGLVQAHHVISQLAQAMLKHQILARMLVKRRSG